MSKPIITEDWQKEPGPFGRWYRTVGTTREYKPMLEPTASGNTGEKTLEEVRGQVQERKTCPFAGDSRACKYEKCALYDADSCFLAAFSPTKDTRGLQCPFSAYRCSASCSLYSGGCRLTGKIFKEV